MKKVFYLEKEEGIASTVGTLFALMIFTSLLTMFATQYIPVYMKTAEADHDMEVLQQFTYLRSLLDSLIITENVNGSVYVPIKLGSSNVPVFSVPTMGQLDLSPYIGPSSEYRVNLTFMDSDSNVIGVEGGGGINMTLPNRYYVAERMVYEDGVVLRYNVLEHTGVMVAEPKIRMSVDSGRVHLDIVLETIYGPAKVVGGMETKGLQFTLVAMSDRTFVLNNAADNFNMTVTSPYYDSWVSWMRNETYEHGVSMDILNQGGNSVMFRLSNVVQVSVTQVFLEMELRR